MSSIRQSAQSLVTFLATLSHHCIAPFLFRKCQQLKNLSRVVLENRSVVYSCNKHEQFLKERVMKQNCSLTLIQDRAILNGARKFKKKKVSCTIFLPRFHHLDAL